jgi:hypothetical protein
VRNASLSLAITHLDISDPHQGLRPVGHQQHLDVDVADGDVLLQLRLATGGGGGGDGGQETLLLKRREG